MIVPALLATTMLTGISAAHAQTGDQIETVTVTAEKRSEDMQKVPISIQALGTQKLEELHLTQLDDYIKYLPSVEFTSGGAPGFDEISMRGVNSGGDGNHSGPLPTVGLYLDEQPITTIAGALDIPSYDLARVEALSGPQGTLYGASSEAGTIRLITNKPDPSGFAASYKAEVNSVDHGGIGYNFDGMVNIPIADNAALRIVAWDQHNAGYIDNVYGTRTFPNTGMTENNAPYVKKNFNTDTKYGFRAALEYDLNSDWTITPFIMAQKENTNGTFSYDPAVGYLKVESYGPNYTRDSWYQGALTVTGKIGNLDLVYSGGHMDRHVKSQEDYNDYSYWYDVHYFENGSPFAQYFTDADGNLVNPGQHILGTDHFVKDSHEIRLSTDKDEQLRATVGAFYERQIHYILQDYEIYGLAPYDDGGLSVPGWPGTIWLTDQKRIDRDIALFGEMAYDILPNLTFTAGIRYFDSANSVKGFYGFSDHYSSHTGVAKCFTPVQENGGLPCIDLDKKTGSEGETHKLNLTWQIDDDHMIYATYATGFRPGGINRAPVPTSTQQPVPNYNPDSLIDLEIGWKTSWFDDHLRWNGAVYDEKWKNFQFSFLGPNALTIVANAGAAAVTGVESDVTLIPLDGLTINGAAAYNDARLTKEYCGYFDPVTNEPVTSCADPVSPKGTQLPVTPLWKLNATARYEWSIQDFLAHLQASAIHQSSTWSDLRKNVTGDPTDNYFTRALLGQNKAYTEFNFTAGIDRDNWEAELYINNAFDNHSQLEHTTQCPLCVGNQDLIYPSQPRTIGLTFSQKFD
jgi:outer membrane receptor protein involved in Fe transport